jgi:hypothetical protein
MICRHPRSRQDERRIIAVRLAKKNVNGVLKTFRVSDTNNDYYNDDD